MFHDNLPLLIVKHDTYWNYDDFHLLMILWSLKPQNDFCNIITTSAQLKQPHFPKKISPKIIHQIGGTGFQKPTKRQLHCRHPTAPAFHSVMSRQRFYQRVVFLCSRNLCLFLTKTKTNWLIYLDLTTFQPVFNSLILCGFLVLPCVVFFDPLPQQIWKRCRPGTGHIGINPTNAWGRSTKYSTLQN